MNLVTVATFSSSFDMHVIKGRLETDGVQCYVKDEQTITWDPLLDIAAGGIKLQVAEEDVELAKELLKETSYEHSSSLAGVSLNTPFRRKLSSGAILTWVILVVSAILAILSLSTDIISRTFSFFSK